MRGTKRNRMAVEGVLAGLGRRCIGGSWHQIKHVSQPASFLHTKTTENTQQPFHCLAKPLPKGEVLRFPTTMCASAIRVSAVMAGILVTLDGAAELAVAVA
ncbi:hypothetical protein Hanom_Chr01g00058661 [Helianthus anomalus]